MNCCLPAFSIVAKYTRGTAHGLSCDASRVRQSSRCIPSARWDPASCFIPLMPTTVPRISSSRVPPRFVGIPVQENATEDLTNGHKSNNNSNSFVRASLFGRSASTHAIWASTFLPKQSSVLVQPQIASAASALHTEPVPGIERNGYGTH